MKAKSIFLKTSSFESLKGQEKKCPKDSLIIHSGIWKDKSFVILKKA
jgi:hypothetical protein